MVVVVVMVDNRIGEKAWLLVVQDNRTTSTPTTKEKKLAILVIVFGKGMKEGRNSNYSKSTVDKQKDKLFDSSCRGTIVM
jgi:hypothetical protein